MNRVAAIDVGTNSVRLLVAEPGEPLNSVERLMKVTRLGAGVDSTGRLDDAALARTLDCIADYAARWQALGAVRARITATSAIRDAADRDRFFDGVRERTGVVAEVLTGEEEARTAFRGATGAVSGEPPYLVLDIGGGSTEFILGVDEPEAMTSRQLGCVRLTERALLSDPPTSGEIDRAADIIDAELDAVARLFDPGRARTLIGVAGTVTTLGALHLGLDRYEPERIHGARVPIAAVHELTERLAALPSARRADLGPMAPGREDVIVGGALILRRVMERFGFGDVLVSETDILDGLAISLLDGSRP
ncbi:MAG TPA: Ppx/GppA phosphatase family protein [Egibacteraceae bacterium]|nr:Ppx/GppA phosphatase family protein [Egibacteraceae bacterium]